MIIFHRPNAQPASRRRGPRFPHIRAQSPNCPLLLPSSFCLSLFKSSPPASLCHISKRATRDRQGRETREKNKETMSSKRVGRDRKTVLLLAIPRSLAGKCRIVESEREEKKRGKTRPPPVAHPAARTNSCRNQGSDSNLASQDQRPDKIRMKGIGQGP